jgi:hypothetical protein
MREHAVLYVYLEYFSWVFFLFQLMIARNITIISASF